MSEEYWAEHQDDPIVPWEWPAFTQVKTRRYIEHLLWDLALRGPVEDKAGRATGRWRERTLEHSPDDLWIPAATGFSQVVRDLADGKWGRQVIELEKKHTAVYRVDLVLEDEELPANPYDTGELTADQRVMEMLGVPQPTEEEAAELQEEAVFPLKALRTAGDGELPPPTFGEPDLSWVLPNNATLTDKILLAHSFILQLLPAVARMEAEAAVRATRAQDPPPHDGMAERLQVTIEECERLRKRLRAAEDAAHARRKEAETLRIANARIQSNLDAYVRGDRVPDGRPFKLLDNMMREKPKSAG